MPRPIIALALGLALAVPALPAAAQDQSTPAPDQSLPAPSDMTEAEREAFRAEVRAYLLENPEVILEAIEILEARRAANEAEADAQLIARHREELFNDPDSWVGGNPDGDVTLVEFLDYRCGYCKRAHPEVLALLERDPNIRYVVKEFPILGPESVAAARMALAALELDRARFGDLHDALMTHDGQLTEAVAYEIAGQVGYDTEALRARAQESDIEAEIRDNYQLARALGINGTPGFVVGDSVIRGYLPADQMAEEVAEAREAMN